MLSHVGADVDGLACVPYLHAPAQHTPRPPVATSEGFPVLGKCHWNQVFRKQYHLMPSMNERNPKHPHAPDNMHSSTEIHPVTALHSNSCTRTHIVTMITLTMDKFILVKVGFSLRNPVDQGPGGSTLRQIAHLRGFTPPGKEI
jgi:hypothetical protein